jgi:hypothetical protein
MITDVVDLVFTRDLALQRPRLRIRRVGRGDPLRCLGHVHPQPKVLGRTAGRRGRADVLRRHAVVEVEQPHNEPR